MSIFNFVAELSFFKKIALSVALGGLFDVDVMLIFGMILFIEAVLEDHPKLPLFFWLLLGSWFVRNHCG